MSASGKKPNINTSTNTNVMSDESKKTKSKDEGNKKEVHVLDVLKEIHQSYQNDDQKNTKDNVSRKTKQKKTKTDKDDVAGEDDDTDDHAKDGAGDDDKNQRQQHHPKYQTPHEKTKAKRGRHHYHPTSSTDDGRVYVKPIGWKAIALDDIHKLIAIFNELISLTLELSIYIGGVVSFFSSFLSYTVRVWLDCVMWWIIAGGLIIYTLADCFRLFKPFDENDMIIRHNLPPWVTKYLIASRFSVAVASNELIATGERALLYKPFYVPKRYVEHASFSVGVVLSIVYSLVNAKEATRRSERMAAKENIDDSVLDVRDHVLETARDAVLDVMKAGVEKKVEE